MALSPSRSDDSATMDSLQQQLQECRQLHEQLLKKSNDIDTFLTSKESTFKAIESMIGDLKRELEACQKKKEAAALFYKMLSELNRKHKAKIEEYTTIIKARKDQQQGQSSKA